MKALASALNIFIIESRLLNVESLSAAVSCNEGLNVVGTSSSGRNLFQVYNSMKIDVTIICIGFDALETLSLVRRIIMRVNNLKIMIVDDCFNRNNLMDFLSIGVHGYVTRDLTLSQFADALYCFFSGDVFLDPVARNYLNDRTLKAARSQCLNISFKEREKSILRGLSKDRSLKEIAYLEKISIDAVRYHLKNMYKKTDTKKPTGLVIHALRHGILELE